MLNIIFGLFLMQSIVPPTAGEMEKQILLGTLDCTKPHNMCPSLIEIKKLSGEDVSSTTTIPRTNGTHWVISETPSVSAGDVVTVVSKGWEKYCFVVATVREKIKFVKVDCKELYD